MTASNSGEKADNPAPRSPEAHTAGESLSGSAKELIRTYLFKLMVPSAIVISITSAALGFAINEVARGQAYVKAYGEASNNILAAATAASKAVGQAEALRDISQKSSSDAETALKSVQNSKLQLQQILAGNSSSIATALMAQPEFKSSIANVSQDELKKLGEEISSIRSTVLTMQNVAAISAIKGTDGPVANRTGSVTGLAGTYSLDNDAIVACPPGSFVSGIQGFRPDGQFPLVQLRYSCRSLK